MRMWVHPPMALSKSRRQTRRSELSLNARGNTRESKQTPVNSNWIYDSLRGAIRSALIGYQSHRYFYARKNPSALKEDDATSNVIALSFDVAFIFLYFSVH